MGEQSERHPYRVHVSGLAKSAVHRREGTQCYEEEYNLGDFFHNHGCAVTWVSLLVDKRSGRSRGFAFVDLEDEESFDLASKLDGFQNPSEVALDEKSGGRITVSPAKPSDDSQRQQQLELAKERNRTDGLQKDLRLYAARINEKMEQIEYQRERQLALQRTGKVEEELKNQRARQKEVQALMVELDAMEVSLTKELKAEKERTAALEELLANNHFDHPDGDDHGGKNEENDEVRPAVMPRIVPSAESLHRSISSFKEEVPSPPSQSTLERTVSQSRAWLVKREEKEEALKRAASIGHDISRGILDVKIDALERSASGRDSTRPRGGSFSKPVPASSATGASDAQTKSVAKESSHPRWGDMSDDDPDEMDSSYAATSIWGRGAGRNDVIVKNLPDLPDDELRTGMAGELARLWEATGRDRPPPIDSVKITRNSAGIVAKSAGVDALIVFHDPYDAWLLVEHCGAQDWSSSCTPTLHGRLLQVEWPPYKHRPLDFRKFTFRADTDASSEVSYNTIGTANSRSSVIAQRSLKGSKEAGKSSGKGTGKGTGNEYVPPQNRTVLVTGIPTDLMEYDVKSEILSLLQRVYQRKNFSFDPKVHLHKGLDGLEVRAPDNRSQQNGGSVKLRLRNYADAVWLVDQASNLKIAGAKLKTFWAQPRSSGGKGGSGYPPLSASKAPTGKSRN